MRKKTITEDQQNEYRSYCRSLQRKGIITFAELMCRTEVKKALEARSDKTWSINDAIIILSRIDDNCLYFKGDRITGNVEYHLLSSEPFRFNEKCDVQFYLWKLMRPEDSPRDAIQDARLSSFYLFDRVGRGRYKYRRNAKKVITKKIEEVEKIVEKSRISITEIEC